MKANVLLEGLKYTLLQGDLNLEITGLACDSREVSPGNMFFCVPGSLTDGHIYASEAVSNGAKVLVVEKDVLEEQKHLHVLWSQATVIQVSDVADTLGIIASRYNGSPSEHMTVIGVTGTKGKTTTTYMLYHMLEHAGYKVGLLGTIEYRIGEVHIPASNTTPDALAIQNMLKKMLRQGTEVVVMEVSSQGLMRKRVSGVSFDYGIFTNLSEDHISPHEHSSCEEYAYWKKTLFSMCKVGIVNGDDAFAVDIMRDNSCRFVTYGLDADVDFKGSCIKKAWENGALGISYILSQGLQTTSLTDAKDEKIPVLVNIPGIFNIYNSLAALAVAAQMKLSLEEAIDSLKSIKVKGRLEAVNISDAFTLLIDYAHNAYSLASVLRCLREYEPKRLIVVFGCGGNRARARRFEMGETAGRLADVTVLTSDNPRYEKPESIIQDIETGIKRTNGDYVCIPDRKEALRHVIMHAKEGDVILLAGKGHEDYQEIAGIKYPMDERILIREILEEENVDEICGYNNRYFA